MRARVGQKAGYAQLRKRSPRRREQMEFAFRTRGGPRPGAGRPKKKNARVPHSKRPKLSRHNPVHVTLRLQADIWNLRSGAFFRRVRGMSARLAPSMVARIVHYSVQKTHLHLIMEADHSRALSGAMRKLGIRLAKCVNKFMKRRGQVVSDRYHAHVLKSPLEVKRAIAYVLGNTRHHAAQAGRTLPPLWFDPCSSAAWFDGWFIDRSLLSAGGLQNARSPPVADEVFGPARSWLLTLGWRRHGSICLNEVPGRI